MLLTRAGSQSTGPDSVAPQWGSAGHTGPASGATLHPAAAGPESTLPWCSCGSRGVAGEEARGRMSESEKDMLLFYGKIPKRR